MRGGEDVPKAEGLCPPFGYPAKPHRNAMQEAAMLKFLTENRKALRKLIRDRE